MALLLETTKQRWIALSTDAKPSSAPVGSDLWCYDTNITFRCYDGTNWEPYEIPYTDAINSLERRSISMIVAKHEMGKEKPDTRKITEQIAKMIIALGDAVLIKRGQFHPKYSIRSLMLKSDPISEMYSLMVATKLTGLPEFSIDSLWQLWNEARNMLREYLAVNGIGLVMGEALLAISERTTQDQLADILKKVGAEKWI